MTDAKAKLSSVEAEQELFTVGGTPIDRMAWRVIKPGVHYTPNKKAGCLMFDAPPPSRGMGRAPWETRPVNLQGRRVGRLTVVGYWGRRKNQGAGQENQRWICRCDCGLYTIRTGKTVVRAKDKDDCCEPCRHLNYLKRAESFRRLGYNEDEVSA